MGETREDVVRAAVQLERDGRKFYLEAANRTPNEEVRKMFASLADDEADHARWIERAAADVDTAAAVNRRLYDRLRFIFADVPEAKLRRIASSERDVDAIHFAISIEDRSVAAYETWARECEDADVRKLCQMLVGVERFHRTALENTLEYFEHTPDWFMKEEQWNFEGA